MSVGERKLKAKQAKVFIEDTLRTEIKGPLLEALKNGVLLCQLLNTLVPGCVKASGDLEPVGWMALDNITQFCDTCKSALEIPEGKIFAPRDLFDGTNPQNVILTLLTIRDKYSKDQKGEGEKESRSSGKKKKKSSVSGAKSEEKSPKKANKAPTSDQYRMGPVKVLPDEPSLDSDDLDDKKNTDYQDLPGTNGNGKSKPSARAMTSSEELGEDNSVEKAGKITVTPSPKDRHSKGKKKRTKDKVKKLKEDDVVGISSEDSIEITSMTTRKKGKKKSDPIIDDVDDELRDIIAAFEEDDEEQEVPKKPSQPAIEVKKSAKPFKSEPEGEKKTAKARSSKHTFNSANSLPHLNFGPPTLPGDKKRGGASFSSDNSGTTSGPTVGGGYRASKGPRGPRRSKIVLTKQTNADDLQIWLADLGFAAYSEKFAMYSGKEFLLLAKSNVLYKVVKPEHAFLMRLFVKEALRSQKSENVEKKKSGDKPRTEIRGKARSATIHGRIRTHERQRSVDPRRSSGSRKGQSRVKQSTRGDKPPELHIPSKYKAYVDAKLTRSKSRGGGGSVRARDDDRHRRKSLHDIPL